MHQAPSTKHQLLEWYIGSGVDEAISDTPRNWLAAPPLTVDSGQRTREAPQPVLPTVYRPPSTPIQPPSEAIASARALADACTTRVELEEAVRNFTGCAIKKTANKTVFSDGNPQARVMIIGEAPGAQEDQRGIPFCGPSGALLDKMLASIGLTREANAYITNTLFWRPPGNRAPSMEELAICEPFVEKHIALINPGLIILAGGIASSAVLKRSEGVTRMRGKFYEYTNGYLKTPVTASVFFHPSYLLRSPAQKRLAWSDLLATRDFLSSKGLI